MTPGNDGRLASVPPRFVYSLNSILLSLVPSASRSPVTTGFVPSTNSEEIKGLFLGGSIAFFFLSVYHTVGGTLYGPPHIRPAKHNNICKHHLDTGRGRVPYFHPFFSRGVPVEEGNVFVASSFFPSGVKEWLYQRSRHILARRNIA